MIKIWKEISFTKPTSLAGQESIPTSKKFIEFKIEMSLSSISPLAHSPSNVESAPFGWQILQNT